LKSLLIVIPTYNEAGNVEELLRQVAKVSAANPDFRVTVAVVDDSSPDRTGDIARGLADELTSDRFAVRVDTRPEKQGLGAAYSWAFNKYLDGEAPPDYVMQMDADLSHQPKYIDDMLEQSRQGADLVVASRYLPHGGTPDWTVKRRVLSVGGNVYTRLLLGSRITDYTGAFTLFTSELLRKVDTGTITATGYGFQIVLKHRALANAHLVRQVPIVFLDRTKGESKIPRDTFITNLVLVWKLRSARTS
jgi:dolichol-phosphate mannosyltransferase